jgi:hypothetical protein
VTPIEGEWVTAPGATLTCAGDACNGGGFQLTHVGADYFEGWFTGTLAGTAGQGTASTVCSFWVPASVYSP